jgi:hypothetical protein
MRLVPLTAMQLFQSCKEIIEIPFPGLPERNPGLKLANAFSVIAGKEVRHFLWSFHAVSKATV